MVEGWLTAVGTVAGAIFALFGVYITWTIWFKDRAIQKRRERDDQMKEQGRREKGDSNFREAVQKQQTMNDKQTHEMQKTIRRVGRVLKRQIATSEEVNARALVKVWEAIHKTDETVVADRHSASQQLQKFQITLDDIGREVKILLGRPPRSSIQDAG